MTPYERVASYGFDPRKYWIDPAGGVRPYTAERSADLARIYSETGAVHGVSLGVDIAIRLRAAGERTSVWKEITPGFDPKDELMVQADGNIVPRDQGMPLWLGFTLALSAPIAAIVLPGVIAGGTSSAVAGTATAGSSAAAASGGTVATVGAIASTGVGAWKAISNKPEPAPVITPATYGMPASGGVDALLSNLTQPATLTLVIAAVAVIVIARMR